MNKQEVLEKLEQKKETILRSQKNLLMGSELWQVYEARAATFMSAINIVEQLNEPQKVKVPAYVAEWFEINKEQLEVAIWDLTTETYETDRDQLSEIQLWIKESDRPYKTLISMQDGYEVEEEPKWIVCYSTMYLKSPLETGQIETVETTPKKELACHFKSYKEAKQQTSLIGGAVEKVEE